MNFDKTYTKVAGVGYYSYMLFIISGFWGILDGNTDF
jgi:hypothetical protein